MILFAIAVSTLLLCLPAAAADDDRVYLFIGDPSPAGWKWLIENAGVSDREAIAKKGIEKLGGEMLSYYWGAHDGRNYITVRLPNDTETVPAMLIMRLSTGMLIQYDAIELIPSSKMPDVIERIADIMAVDDIQSGDEQRK